MAANEHRALFRRLPIYAGIGLLVWFAGEGILAFHRQPTIPSANPAVPASSKSTPPNNDCLLGVTIPLASNDNDFLHVTGPGNCTCSLSSSTGDTVLHFLQQNMTCNFTDPQPTSEPSLLTCRECLMNVTVTGTTVFLDPNHKDRILSMLSSSIHYRLKLTVNPNTRQVILTDLSPRQDYENIQPHTGVAANYGTNSGDGTRSIPFNFAYAYDPDHVVDAENYGPFHPTDGKNNFIWSGVSAFEGTQGYTFFVTQKGDN